MLQLLSGAQLENEMPLPSEGWELNGKGFDVYLLVLELMRAKLWE